MQGQLENPLKIREVKRDLARVLTVLSEKQRAAAAAG
jgi:ribosomal protein L29